MNSILTIVLFLVLSIYTACKEKSSAAANTSSDKIRLVWSGDASSTVTIGWDQGIGERPAVYYGSEDKGIKWQEYSLNAKPSRKLPGYRGMNTHFARLSGLQPDTEYYFVIRDERFCTARYWFRTAPDRPKAFTFIAGGDTKSSGTALQAGRISHSLVPKLRPLFIVFVGDFCSGDGTDDDDWEQWLDDWSTLTVSRDGRMFPIVPVHGNHEDGDKAVLNKLFDVPFQNGDEEDIYYSTSFGGFFHFIALNSQIDEGGSQRQWLEEDLKKHEDYTFKAAGYHKPFHPHTAKKSENEYQYEQWAPLFYKYGLDLAFGGDSHMSKITFPLRPSQEEGSYQGFIRDDARGTMFIGEGSWGANPRDNNDDKPWTLRSGSFNQVKWLHVFPALNNVPADIDIRTIITSTRDKEGNPVSHVEKVGSLSETDLFAVPEGLKVFSTEPFGEVITYPFNAGSEEVKRSK